MFLEAFDNHKPHSLPKLEYFEESHPAFGISPVGIPLNVRNIQSPSSLISYMGDVLDALHYLHTHCKIVHRDVRLGNLILVNDMEINPNSKTEPILQKVVLIDFDNATHIGEETTYEGGAISCPRVVLQNIELYGEQLPDPILFNRGPDDLNLMDTGPEIIFQSKTPLSTIKYQPEASHDYEAFIVLLITILFPKKFVSFNSRNIEDPKSKEFQDLVSFWNFIEKSEIWRVALICAEREDKEGMVGFVEALVPF
ncbi:hypothetical protein ABW20_dc0107535 [Dactylellina cionopaga]|nr:hypothetical protein ABW20_dc0107535 [Dactylellina cionopaga]